VAPRAIWKGYLKVGELVCPVALHTAVSMSERVSLHMLNRKTGNRLHRQFVDSETGKEVEREDQVKGYETGPNDYIILDQDEITAAVPQSDKTLSIDSFIPCEQIDDLYFDKPYYLVPAGPGADKAYAILQEGLRTKKVAALASAILFRRVRLSKIFRPSKSKRKCWSSPAT
jgi:DNA end-binding protein Ku